MINKGAFVGKKELWRYQDARYDKENLISFRRVRIIVKTSIIVVVSVHLHETIRLPVVGFLWKLTRITGTLHEDICTFMKISRWVITKIRNISDKSCRENQNTDFMFGNLFSRKSCRLWGNVGNMVQPDRPQMTVYGACALHSGHLRQEYRHAFIIFNTATMVTRTRLIVTLYVRCLSCWQYNLLRNDAVQTSTVLQLVHIGVPVLRYQTNTDKSSHILLNNQFINTLRSSNVFRHLNVHLQGV
jgi:hypothetical protein